MRQNNNKNVNTSITDTTSKIQQANPQTITPISYSEQLRMSIKTQHTPIMDDKVPHLNNITQYNCNISKLFIDLFGESAMEQELTQIGSPSMIKRHEAVDTRLVQCITNQIVRLQQIESDYLKYQRILERNAKSGSNEEKWKIIVLSYRQKLQKIQHAAKQQKKMKELLQKELNTRMQENQRLCNMNSIKFQRLNEVTNDLEEKIFETKELNNVINEMEINMSTIKKETQKLQQSLLLAERQNQNLTRELHEISQSLQIQREKSILIERQKVQEVTMSETNILSTEDDDIRRQIQDIKSKYDHQIQQLQDKLRICNHEKEQFLARILELESIIENNNERQKRHETIQQQSQTQQIMANVYNTSLYDDLYNENMQEMAEQSNLQIRQSFQQENEQEFDLSINPQSANNHRIDTPRQFYQDYSDRQMERNNLSSNLDASFDEGNSLSNAPSRYMDTLQQLTSELAQAYQKINEMTQKMNALEDQNKMLATKVPTERAGKLVGSMFNNFFKK